MQTPWGGYGPPPGIYRPLPLAAPPDQPTPQDVSQLRTVAICTFVYAALVGVASLLGLVYVAIGLAVATGAPAAPGDPSPEVIGGVFAIAGLVVCALFGAKAVLLVFSGVGMLRQKWRTASYVAAGLACANMPIGTILGVFTFLVLGRPGVRALYDAQKA